jgi:hypothetical protein
MLDRFAASYSPVFILDTASLRFEPPYNEEMVLAVGRHHAFAKRRFVRMVELHRQRLVLLPAALKCPHGALVALSCRIH